MKCPKCAEKDIDSDLEKARDSSVMLCRSCGHTTSGMTRAEMAQKIEGLEKWKEQQEKKAKEAKEKKQKKEEDKW